MKALIDGADVGMNHFQRVLSEDQLLRAVSLSSVYLWVIVLALCRFSACCSATPKSLVNSKMLISNSPRASNTLTAFSFSLCGFLMASTKSHQLPICPCQCGRCGKKKGILRQVTANCCIKKVF